jgi:hypothetical protein
VNHLLPADVAVCPECGGRIQVEIWGWETETRIPTEGGCIFMCETDTTTHRTYSHAYGGWTEAIQPWLAWVAANIVVPERTPEEERALLAAWNAWARGAV